MFKWTTRSLIKMQLTYIQQSGSPPIGDGGDQYTGLDRFGRVIDQRWIKTSSGADLERVQYGFDRASNRVWRDNTVADALSSHQDEFYTYDGLHQLLTLQRGTLNSGKTGISGTPTWEEDFTFDPTGNWENYVHKVSGTTTLNQDRTHNAVNEVETIGGSGSLVAFSPAGNMTKTPKPNDWSSAYDLTYDAWNRLVKVKSGTTTVATYAYDGLNRRTAKTTSSTSTRHYYFSSQWQILEERLNTATTPDRQFVWGLMGLDNLVLRDTTTERLYSLQDAIGSVTAVADTGGTMQERYGYNAFGQPRVMTMDFDSLPSSSYAWETLYDSYLWDSETHFFQVRYRYLHPTLGRWISRDPLYEPGFALRDQVRLDTAKWLNSNRTLEYGNKANSSFDGTGSGQDSMNLYVYVKNAPINYLDASGLVSVNFLLDILGLATQGPCGNVSISGSLTLVNYHVTGITYRDKVLCLGLTTLLGHKFRNMLKGIPYSKTYSCPNGGTCYIISTFGPLTHSFVPSSPLIVYTDRVGDLVPQKEAKCKVELDLNGSVAASGAVGFCCQKTPQK